MDVPGVRAVRDIFLGPETDRQPWVLSLEPDQAPSLDMLQAELTATLEGWGRPYELVYVDDGSTDDSFDKLRAIQAGDEPARA